MPLLAERFRPGSPVTGSIPKSDVIPYRRPTDWLALPAVNVGDQKIVGLYAVFNCATNHVAFRCSGATTIDWGDGTAPENVAAAVTAEHNYSWAAVSAATLTSRGYRQVIITVTPQAGQNLTSVDLYRRGAVLPASTISGWLDIKMAGSLISTLLLTSTGTTVFHKLLEQFEFVGTNTVTTFQAFFSGCISLQSVPQLWTASATIFTSMFNACASLRNVPLLNTALGTQFGGMFASCSSLREIPWMNTSAGVTFTTFAISCASLTKFPSIDTGNSLNFSSMFNSCTSLVEIPWLNTSKGTNFSSMFNTCRALKTVPLLDTSKGTNMAVMFGTCVSLQEIPLLDTHLNTTFDQFFAACTALRTIPLLDTSAGTTFSNMFLNNSSLVTIPLIDTSHGIGFVQMFSGCSSLLTVPALVVSAATGAGVFANMFTGCVALRSAPLVGAVQDLTFNTLNLGPADLDAIYTGLGTAAKTITVTGNWGTASDTPSIATAKGWTVTGS